MKKKSIIIIAVVVAIAIIAGASFLIFSGSLNSSNRGSSSSGSAGLEYTLNDDGKGYTLTSIGTCNSKSITVPSKYEGKPVTAIGDGAFEEADIKSISLPNSVESIGARAFYNCFSLKTVELGKSLKTIGDYAFYDCYNIKKLVLPDSVAEIGANTFKYCFDEDMDYNEYDNGLYIGTKSNPYLVLIDAKNEQITACDVHPDTVVINSGAFAYCYDLVSVTMGDSVISMGDGAFYDCTSLTNLTLSDSLTTFGNKMFYNCSSLQYNAYDNALYIGNEYNPYMILIKSVDTYISNCTINRNTRFICDSAFSGCYSLKSITIPKSILGIGSSAFAYCSNLASIEVEESNTKYQSINGNLYDKNGRTLLRYAGGKTGTSFTIPASVTTIESNAFSSCYNLETLTIPKSVTTIKDAFGFYTDLENFYYTGTVEDWCKVDLLDSYSNPMYYAEQTYFNGSLLKNAVIPDSITYIDEYAFYACKTLESIEIGDSVTTIGYCAFNHCPSLKSVTIGASLDEMDDGLFYGCDSLQDITVSKDNKTYKSLYGNLYNKDGTKLIKYAPGKTDTSFTLPSTVTSIAEYAFANCKSLMYITLNDSLENIDSYTFIGCSSLESIEIPDSVKSISCYVFQGCTSLSYIYIGKSVSDISSDVFSNCPSLTSIIVDENNKNYKSVNGNLYNKDETALIKYAVGKTNNSFTLPSTVTRIESNAFQGAVNLTGVTLHDSLEYIGGDAFEYCESLTSIFIPDSVTYVGGWAFYGCNNITVRCEADSKPDDWSDSWDYLYIYDLPVIWGCDN